MMFLSTYLLTSCYLCVLVIMSYNCTWTKVPSISYQMTCALESTMISNIKSTQQNPFPELVCLAFEVNNSLIALKKNQCVQGMVVLRIRHADLRLRNVS